MQDVLQKSPGSKRWPKREYYCATGKLKRVTNRDFSVPKFNAVILQGLVARRIRLSVPPASYALVRLPGSHV